MSDQQYKTQDKFDREHGNLSSLPTVASTKPATRVTYSPFLGSTRTYIIQTMREREQGDYIFIQYLDGEGSVRLVIPPEAADAIAQQRDALTTKNRKRAARDRAAADKAAGRLPGFMRNGKAKGRRKNKGKVGEPPK